jgi:sarcosine oxidase subunit gamma
MRSRMLDPCHIIRVQSWDIEARAPSSVEHLLGIVWPRDTGFVASGVADVICTGPTDWLVIATDSAAVARLQPLATAFEGSTFRATDVSQALQRVEIDGREVRELLAKGCSIDLHPSRFPPGRSVRTRFTGMPVIIRCTGASTFECLVTLSYSDYLLTWLQDAELEFPVASRQ